MVCTKNGVSAHFPDSFEPCAEYWDEVLEDNGSPFHGRWCHCSNIVVPKTDDQAVLNYKIGISPKKGKGYPISNKKECAGYVRKREDFLNFVKSVKKKK